MMLQGGDGPQHLQLKARYFCASSGSLWSPNPGVKPTIRWFSFSKMVIFKFSMSPFAKDQRQILVGKQWLESLGFTHHEVRGTCSTNCCCAHVVCIFQWYRHKHKCKKNVGIELLIQLTRQKMKTSEAQNRLFNMIWCDQKNKIHWRLFLMSPWCVVKQSRKHHLKTLPNNPSWCLQDSCGFLWCVLQKYHLESPAFLKDSYHFWPGVGRNSAAAGGHPTVWVVWFVCVAKNWPNYFLFETVEAEEACHEHAQQCFQQAAWIRGVGSRLPQVLACNFSSVGPFRASILTGERRRFESFGRCRPEKQDGWFTAYMLVASFVRGEWWNVFLAVLGNFVQSMEAVALTPAVEASGFVDWLWAKNLRMLGQPVVRNCWGSGRSKPFVVSPPLLPFGKPTLRFQRSRHQPFSSRRSARHFLSFTCVRIQNIKNRHEGICRICFCACEHDQMADFRIDLNLWTSDKVPKDPKRKLCWDGWMLEVPEDSTGLFFHFCWNGWVPLEWTRDSVILGQLGEFFWSMLGKSSLLIPRC